MWRAAASGSSRRPEQIVLSSGTIANPQLLMLSGVGPADHLQEMGIPVVHDLPGVGRNFSDHPLIFIDASVQDHVPLERSRAAPSGGAALHFNRLESSQRH